MSPFLSYVCICLIVLVGKLVPPATQFVGRTGRRAASVAARSVLYFAAFGLFCRAVPSGRAPIALIAVAAGYGAAILLNRAFRSPDAQ